MPSNVSVSRHYGKVVSVLSERQKNVCTRFFPGSGQASACASLCGGSAIDASEQSFHYKIHNKQHSIVVPGVSCAYGE